MKYQKMNPEIKRAWVATLRHGKYKQGRFRLRSALNNVCCLGVLCDIIDPSGWSVAKTCDGYVHRECRGRPSEIIEQKASLEEAARSHLISLNDERGQTFPEIADWIERNL